MDLRSLTHETLWNKTDKLIKHERKVVIATIHHLREIQRRRFYAEHGYNSLWDMLVRGHHFSDGAASRRINSLKLIDMHPEIEAKIASGTMTLTNASALYVCFKNEDLSQEQQADLINNVEKKSTRAALREIAKLAHLGTEAAWTSVGGVETTDLRARRMGVQASRLRIDSSNSIKFKLIIFSRRILVARMTPRT